MSTVEEIKNATAGLSAEEQYELFKWLTQSDAFKKRQFAELKREISIGVQQLERGQYKSYDDRSLPQLADEISAYGRKKLSPEKPSQP